MEEVKKTVGDVQKGIVDPEAEEGFDEFDDEDFEFDDEDFEFDDEDFEFETEENDEQEAEEGAPEADEQKEGKSDKKAESEVDKANKKAKPIQTPEINAQYAQRRRSVEGVVSEKGQKLKELLSPYGVKSSAELPIDVELSADKISELKTKAEELGKDPEDYVDSHILRQENRLARVQRQAIALEQAISDEARRKTSIDLEEFKAAYPETDPADIAKDKKFKQYSEGKLHKGLAAVYKEYLDFLGIPAEKAKQSAQQNAARATGTGESGETVTLSSAERYMLKQYNDTHEKKMTPAQYKKYKGA